MRKKAGDSVARTTYLRLYKNGYNTPRYIIIFFKFARGDLQPCSFSKGYNSFSLIVLQKSAVLYLLFCMIHFDENINVPKDILIFKSNVIALAVKFKFSLHLY